MRRKAFTMIELMVVIAIIGVLAGLVIWGLKGGLSGGGSMATGATLKNLDGMVSEWLLTTKSQPLPRELSEDLYAPIRLDRNDQATQKAIIMTENALTLFTRLPKNRDSLAGLPASQRKEYTANQPHLVLDSFGSPIIFVPASGLLDVGQQGDTTFVSGTNYTRGNRVIGTDLLVRNGKPTGYRYIYTCIQANNGIALTNTAYWVRGVRSPSGKPFFASAGPDGDFQFGDDNLYSFEQ